VQVAASAPWRGVIGRTARPFQVKRDRNDRDTPSEENEIAPIRELYKRKESVMKVSHLILAIALGTAAASAFAQSATSPATNDDMSVKWSQAGTFEQQAEARNTQLAQQGIYSQYED
jgi:hypothetical protein